MGFKCPVCMSDFKNDIEKWREHIEKEHDGIGKDMLNIMINTCEQAELKGGAE